MQLSDWPAGHVHERVNERGRLARFFAQILSATGCCYELRHVGEGGNCRLLRYCEKPFL